MADKTGISWCDATWNPIRGCSRVSEGCRHCYAERVAARFCGPGQPYEGLIKLVARHPRQLVDGGDKSILRVATESRWNGAVHMVPEHLADPLRWKKPRRIFVNSMSDLFHEALTNEQIAAVFGVMAAAPQHTFQVLTKRAKRMREYLQADRREEWSSALARHHLAGERPDMLCDQIRFGERALPNVWLGVSVENQAAADERIPELLATPAAVRFLSCEPLIGALDLSPWLGAHDVEQDQEGRGVRLLGGDGRRDGNRHGWSDLACSDTASRPLGRPAEVGSLRENDRRPGRNGGVSECAGDGGREADDRAVASPGVVPLHGRDTRRAHREPQEWTEGRQPVGESRARDGLRATDPREPGSRDRLWGEPDGGAQPVHESDDRAGDRDQDSTRDRRDLRDDRCTLRDHVPTGLADRARSQSLHWIIAGCESGPGARPCDVAWLRSLRDQCGAAGVPFFLKQAQYTAEVGRPLERTLLAVHEGQGSKRKAGGVIELPYLDGVQHAAFPEETR